MPISPMIKSGVLAVSLLALVACDSAEERAEAHFQSGVELLESGDVERAIVEFRNVLSLDEFHKGARLAYARAALDRGNLSEAYSNFLRLVEDNPNDFESRVELTKLAISSQNWSEAVRHSDALREASADVEGADVINLIMRFRQAIIDNDVDAVAQLTTEAETLVQTNPDDENLRRILVEGYVKGGDSDLAIEQLDKLSELEPNNRLYYDLKTSVLSEARDVDSLEAHFRNMSAQFPDDNQIKATLVRLLSSVGRTEDAEAFLRDEIAASDDAIEIHVGLIAFLRELRGNEAALEEIAAAIPQYEDARILRGLRAGILFDEGQRDDAIEEMQSVVDTSEPSDATNRFKITLAKMLEADSNEVGSRTLIEEVLADDPTQIDALKMSAGWQIEDDQTDEAINSLRLVLDQEPQDSEAMTLMAEAHQRAGEFELAQDLLALAAEASKYAPAESLRFARLLIEDDRWRPAEDVLINALRANPDNLQLLDVLGSVYLQSEDYPRASQVENTLRRQDNTDATRLADRLRLQILSRQEGRAQALATLEQLANQADATTGARLSLLAAKLQEGDGARALELANEIAEANPGNLRAQMVLGNTQLALQDFESAENTLRSIVDAEPAFEQAWIQLVRVQSSQGRRDVAQATVDEALGKNPDAPNILWAKASFLEQANDIDGAIEIYEALYADNSNSLVVANNLASLLATYKDDEASLERAFIIARRLRGTEIGPFQDTYGWILFRRGEAEEAVTYLEPAASALATDPIVQFHLGSAYAALDRKEDAVRQFERVLELAGENDPRPQIEITKAELERLSGEAGTE